jgi:cell division protein FtsW (lipid II flippase)
MSYVAPQRPVTEPFAPERESLAERLGLAHLDWPLALSAVALVAFSIFTLAQATSEDVPGSPGYYVDRQAIYAVLGVIGMALLTRIDYSRFRELRVGIYTFLCVSVSMVFLFGFAARGSRKRE